VDYLEAKLILLKAIRLKRKKIGKLKDIWKKSGQIEKDLDSEEEDTAN